MDKRTVSVMVKLTPEEKKLLVTIANRSGQSLSVCLRTLVYEKYRAEVGNIEEMHKVRKGKTTKGISSGKRTERRKGVEVPKL